MKTRTRERTAYIWNIAIVVMTAIGCAVMTVSAPGPGLLISRGWENLKYFTVLSNLFEGAMSLILAIRLGRVLRGRAEGVPHALYLLKFLAVVSVSVTFLVVALFFGPIFGYLSMYRRANLWFHLLVPLAAIGAFLCGERFDRISSRETWLAPLPALLYGAVYTVNVLVNGPGEFPDANDFYGFTHWGLPAAFCIFGGILLLSWIAGRLLRWGSGRKR